MSGGYQRARERNEQIRAGLEPFAPGERPAAVSVAAALMLLLAVANVALYAADVEVQGEKPGLLAVLAFAAIMVAGATALWRMQYWAVMGFQVLLGVSLVIAGLSLALASNLEAAALCVGILGLGGWLFWKLIRTLARLQIPQQPRAR